MKNRVPLLCFLTTLVLFLSVGISLNAQQTPSQPPSQTPDQTTQPAPNSPADSAQPTGAQSFSGTIVKSGDRYMLQDDASGKTYDIDHQDEVQKYEGKRVKVHGTLDGKMIHLQ